MKKPLLILPAVLPVPAFAEATKNFKSEEIIRSLIILILIAMLLISGAAYLLYFILNRQADSAKARPWGTISGANAGFLATIVIMAQQELQTDLLYYFLMYVTGAVSGALIGYFFSGVKKEDERH